jgi:hypothetical protein
LPEPLPNEGIGLGESLMLLDCTAQP